MTSFPKIGSGLGGEPLRYAFPMCLIQITVTHNYDSIVSGEYKGKEHTTRIYPKIKSLMDIAFVNVIE